MHQAYVPDVINELTRIVVTTRNRNPSVEEYDREVPTLWRRCEAIQSRIQAESRAPSIAELQEVAASVANMLKIKHVPSQEVAERVNQALSRATSGPYPVDAVTVRREFST